MKVKEERGKAGLKVSIQQTKIGIQSCHFMVYNGETMETVTDFIFVVSKITADGDCSCETKRHLLLEGKVLTNLDSILKSRDIIANKAPSSQGYGFSSSHVWMWELDYKKKLNTEGLMLLNCDVVEDCLDSLG